VNSSSLRDCHISSVDLATSVMEKDPPNMKRSMVAELSAYGPAS
jgi:hypothetical protein